MPTTLLKPLLIPPAILSLKQVKLPEKLLLALYAADPATTRVRRALSMTRAGLRQLEQRLIEKGLLTLEGARRLIRVPGLSGHFVPDSKATKNANKVARRKSKTTEVDTKSLVVPGELLDFKYLLASEKMLLAYYAAHSDAQNEHVVAALGVSLSGLKKLKRGLLNKQVLVATDGGYKIRLPGHVLVRNSQGGHFVPELEAVKNGNEVALPTPKLVPARDLHHEWSGQVKYLSTLRFTQFGSLQEYTAKMRQRVEKESPEGREREAVLTTMKGNEDRYFAQQYVYDNIPRNDEAAYIKRVENGTPEQLAAFRERAEGMALAGLPAKIAQEGR